LPQADPIEPQYLSLTTDQRVQVEIRQSDSAHIYHAVMIAPRRAGLLSKAAGVLTLNWLRVDSAWVNIHEGAAITRFEVSPHFGSPAPAELLRQQFIAALSGDLDVIGTLAKRDSDAANSASVSVEDMLAGVPAFFGVHVVTSSTAPPRILWFDTAAQDQLIIEVRAVDRTGLLGLLAWALERAGVDIVWARVTTFGSMFSGVFCVVPPAEFAAAEPTGERDTGVRAVVEQHLFAVLRDGLVVDAPSAV
jgi:[protein-PII] uridylyltransferase